MNVSTSSTRRTSSDQLSRWHTPRQDEAEAKLLLVRGGIGEMDITDDTEFHSEDGARQSARLLGEAETVEQPKGSRRSVELTGDAEQQILALYLEYRPRLFRYVRRLGLHQHDAEEIIQEAFIRLTTSLRDGNEIDSVEGWIVRVVHNLAINLLLKNERDEARIRETSEFEWASFIDPGSTPEEALLKKEQRAKLETALSRFSPLKRQCYWMRVEGFVFKDIGLALGVSTQRAALIFKQVVARLSGVL